MASKSPPPPFPSSSSRSNPPLDASTKKLEDASPAVKDVLSVIESLKKQVAAKRVVTVKV
ncbi:histone-lysine N-methyltransferase CLF-like [Trifolium medium]|uniref:Histone-lysine N-methyltransferase CLF-like n=1 Tax=Trifolium medium TaxID=97028 RepID=A0A392Q616_9FABA|nr:histone-lysine N-methyltransferase CLF-like [Trifolium medium]